MGIRKENLQYDVEIKGLRYTKHGGIFSNLAIARHYRFPLKMATKLAVVLLNNSTRTRRFMNGQPIQRSQVEY